MMQKVSKKAISFYLISSFFTILAFTMEYSTSLQREGYLSSFGYYKDRFIESFFSYQFDYYLLLPLFVCAYFFVEQNTKKTTKGIHILSIFFSVMLVLSNSFRKTNSWDYCFYDAISILKSLIAVIGYYFVLRAILRLIYKYMERSILKREGKENSVFLCLFHSERGVVKSVLLIAVIIVMVWLPILILCFPGGSCVDVTYQISQALGDLPYSTQHSILYTLFLKVGLALGQGVFHSYNVGMFFIIMVQTSIFALVLAYSIYRLNKKKVNKGALFFVLCIYCLTPIYSNLATMAIKDTLFCAAILWFVVELVGILLDTKVFLRNKMRCVSFIMSAIFVTILRNNGIYVISISLFVLILFLIKNKVGIKNIISLGILPLVGFFLLSNVLIFATDASKTTSKEMLSIPFQQTARYLSEYEGEITEEEEQALEGVFIDVSLLKEQYNPNISDPIKNLYREEATQEEIMEYAKAWISMGLRHPGIYIEAFLNHSYGWFDPGSNNWIRYQGRMSIFTTPEYLGTPDKALYYVYNFLNRLPVIGLLENVGIFVWGMLVASCYLLYKKKKVLLIAFTPLYVSLLVCIASPAFWLHPRYAFPIILSMPFLWIHMRVVTEETE